MPITADCASLPSKRAPAFEPHEQTRPCYERNDFRSMESNDRLARRSELHNVQQRSGGDGNGESFQDNK